MTAANETRRSVMNTAWSFKRSEPARAFAECLRGAWKIIKRLARSAASLMARARRNGGRLNLSPSLIRSPSTAQFAGSRFGRTNDRHAGRAISVMGR
jgi:hypothetical protein